MHFNVFHDDLAKQLLAIWFLKYLNRTLETKMIHWIILNDYRTWTNFNPEESPGYPMICFMSKDVATVMSKV